MTFSDKSQETSGFWMWSAVSHANIYTTHAFVQQDTLILNDTHGHTTQSDMSANMLAELPLHMRT